jgi:hypothetical protein
MINPYFDEIPESSGKPDYNNVLSVEIITDVTSEPVSTADIKTHLRVQHSAEDTYIAQLAKECREELEEELNVAFAYKTIKVRVVNKQGSIRLPLWTHNGELIEITDQDGEVISEDAYEFYDGVLVTRFTDPVYVEYTTGFSTLPNKYKKMLKERVAYGYSHRGDEKKNSTGSWIV